VSTKTTGTDWSAAALGPERRHHRRRAQDVLGEQRLQHRQRIDAREPRIERIGIGLGIGWAHVDHVRLS
jgi:hypothetical protein